MLIACLGPHSWSAVSRDLATFPGLAWKSVLSTGYWDRTCVLLLPGDGWLWRQKSTGLLSIHGTGCCLVTACMPGFLSRSVFHVLSTSPRKHWAFFWWPRPWPLTVVQPPKILPASIQSIYGCRCRLPRSHCARVNASEISFVTCSSHLSIWMHHCYLLGFPSSMQRGDCLVGRPARGHSFPSASKFFLQLDYSQQHTDMQQCSLSHKSPPWSHIYFDSFD